MRRLASFLLALGATVGAIGAIGVAIGFEPSRLPRALIDISVYKLVFIAAAAILASGAVVYRAERRYRASSGAAAAGTPELEAGDPSEALRRAQSARERERP
jgi:hypothetical protein